jgi:Neutral/alkaline non-lysosomal ceramidase, N-terminal
MHILHPWARRSSARRSAGGPRGLALALVLAACSSDKTTKTSAPVSDASVGDGSTNGSALSDVGDVWQAGASVADITPTDAQIASQKLFMGAYGFLTGRGPATGVHDHVYARAMVLRHKRDAVVMTILDMPGISNRVIHAVADIVNGHTHIPKESIYVGATHSHSAPDLQGLWGSVPEDYKTLVETKTAQAIEDAFNAAAPADLMVSKGTAPNRNRRDWPFTDTELTVLDAKAKDGAHIVTLIQFAAHPVVLGAGNKLISRDFVGYLVDHAEEKLGGSPVLYFNGVIGDASPDYNGPAADFAKCQAYGNIVADAALATMASQSKVTPGIYLDHEPWRQEVTNAAFVGLGNAGILDYDFVTDAGFMGIDTQFNYLRFGNEVQVVVFPGEALTRTGLRVKAKMTSPFHLWLGLTTDSLGYFVPSDEWQTGRNGDYEESVSTGQTAGDNAVRVLQGAIGRDPDPPPGPGLTFPFDAGL